MVRRFSRGRGRLGSDRIMSWLPIDIASFSVSAAGTIVNSLTTAEKARRPFTVIRTHLEVAMNTDQIIASEDQIGAVGMCVVSDQAVAIGAMAVPTPVTDLDSDLWFVHQLMFGEFVFMTAAGFQARTSVRTTIDSKAMRKVDDSEDLIMVAQSSSALGEGITMITGGRLLIKEH